MTEQEWMASDSPADMLEAMTQGEPCAGKTQAQVNRRLRLFACAVCREAWAKLTDPRSRRAVEAGEEIADGLRKVESSHLIGAAFEAWREAGKSAETGLAHNIMCDDSTIMNTFGAFFRRTKSSHSSFAALLRSIVPWKPLTRPPITATVLALAEAAYANRVERKCASCGGSRVSSGTRPGSNPPAFNDCPKCSGFGITAAGQLCPDRLAMVGDALEDCGVVDAAVLMPLRGKERCLKCRGRGKLSCSKCSGEGCSAHGMATNGPCTAGNRCPDCKDSPGWAKATVPCYRGFYPLDLILGKS